MPKQNKPPKYCKMGKYAVVYLPGKKKIYLGLYGSPESQVAYSRFLAERQANPTGYVAPQKEGGSITIRELAAAFLDHAEATLDIKDYLHCRTVVFDFLLKLYGDNTLVDDFKPSSLKLVRENMIQSQRFCRNTINKYTKKIISFFTWGVEEELVQETTMRALKAVKSLPEGYPGTFDNPEREDVPYNALQPAMCAAVD